MQAWRQEVDPDNMVAKKKIMLAFGTRPEAIKMAPLYHRLREASDRYETVLCVTAQHRSMLDDTLKVFGIRPDIDLNIMTSTQDLYDITAAVLLQMRDVLRSHRPSLLLVHGDTTTTMASAVAGFYSRIRVGHVEAGLRTRDMNSPFPEEFNRQVTTKVAQWHFAPTSTSRRNLIQEGIEEASITVTGNTVIDAMLWVLKRIEEDRERRERLERWLSERLGFDWMRKRFILITGHRRENFGEGFRQISEAIRELSIRYETVHFVYPVHLNPNVQAPVRNVLSKAPNVHLLEPMEYEAFIYLLKHCYLVLTDSGGIQEEAPSLGKPVLVMRDTTERPEAVSAGTVRLTGSGRSRIVMNVSQLLDDGSAYTRMCRAHNPYGDGRASERIVQALDEWEGGKPSDAQPGRSIQPGKCYE